MVGLATAMFLVVLDSSMVNLASSTIREGLGLTATELTLVVDSYLVAFAGLLLLGGRLADVLGGRRMFLGGLALYVAATILCAVAADSALLIAARILQGIGAAAVVPAALSLVLALYTTPAERTRATGIWGAVAGMGSLAGVFLGGTLTQLFGWQAVFIAPVPFAIAGAILVWRFVGPVRGHAGRFDVLGASTITLGISGLALGMVSASDAGWTNIGTVLGLVMGIASLVAFVLVESRSSHPLVPLTVFRRRPVVTANVVMLLIGGTMVSLFFFLPQYQQEVLGMTPLSSGMTQLPLAGMVIVGSILSPMLTARIGLTTAQPIALTVLLAGLVWLTLDPTTAGFSLSLAGAFLLIGTGLGLSSVNATAMAVRDSTQGEQGLLSGLVNAAQQLGGAVGLAALAGVAIGAAGAAGASISFAAAFVGLTVLIGIALVVSLVSRAIASSGRAPSDPDQHRPASVDTASRKDR
jgi:EmrB/QacA subfamily drug resistance transporter